MLVRPGDDVIHASDGTVATGTASGMDRLSRLARATARLDLRALVKVGGEVRRVTTTHVDIAGLSYVARLGDCVRIESAPEPVLAQVMRIEAEMLVAQPFLDGARVKLGTRAWLMGPISLAPAASWLGRVIDPLGRPVDGAGPLVSGTERIAIDAAPLPAMQRGPLERPVPTGVRVIDLFTPIMAGQRIGIFAGSGVGKSTLIGMLAAARGFDAIVVALVGERSREVNEFLAGPLAGARARAITVVATGDESAMLRRLAPLTAMRIAEHLRDQGRLVLLVVDSLTRFAHASREVAIAAGEPPVARGYVPSIFADIPRLLERAGPGHPGRGSITGVFSVLVDGDDHNEPISDCVRGVLDGHVVLERALAERGRLPAVDPLRSLSRLTERIHTPVRREIMQRIKALVARFEETRDLRLIGGVQAGADPELDKAVAVVPQLYRFLAQSRADAPGLDAVAEAAKICGIQ